MSEASLVRDLSPEVAAMPSLAPDCIDSRYDREQIRVGLALADHYEPLLVAGRYRLLQRRARGAMGSIYLARDDRLGRELALKLVNSRSAAHEPSGRLVAEAQALARVRHPNVLVVYDVGEAEGEAFITMDYLEGPTLRTWQRGRSTAELLRAYIEAGRGLAAAHRGGVVHRDFKPDNVMVAAREGVRSIIVVDFGLAGTHDRAELMGLGTPGYMPPEQLAGEADPRCDQYAFCVSLWEALCGQRPFPSARTSTQAPARPTTLPRWLYRCLRRGLAFVPTQRHADMHALLRELENGLARRQRLPSAAIVLLSSSLLASWLLSTPLRSPAQVAMQTPSSADVIEPRFAPVRPTLEHSPTPLERAPAPASMSPESGLAHATRACTRDTLYSRLSELGYRCHDRITLELDVHGRVDAPTLPELHGLLAPGGERNCTMKVKCPDDEF